MPGTVKLHRVLPTKPEKVYRAFIEADALAKGMEVKAVEFVKQGAEVYRKV